MKAYGGEKVYFQSFLTTTLNAGEYLPAPSASPGGKSPKYLQSRRNPREKPVRNYLYI